MDHHPIPHPADPRQLTPRRGAGALRRVAALWRDVVGSWRSAIAASRIEPLDAATLRDLGITRCEIDSIRAEADGLAPLTRRRVMHAPIWWPR
jgi:uncharacterized protein YjiS (DUF1127 family)